MRSKTRLLMLALALAGTLLAGCSHQDKNAPLAYVPADTPYVVANLKPLDAAVRKAYLARADAQLPAQLAQMDQAASQVAGRSPALARLLHALADAYKGNTIEGLIRQAGIDPDGHFALYGLGLSPVMRGELRDPKAFDAFAARLEAAYGKPLDSASVDGQAYRQAVSSESHTALLVATVGKQAVLALLPENAPKTMLRQALGLDRPAHSLQDSGALAELAKAKGYQPWLVGKLDVQRLLSLAAGGNDPLFATLLKAGAQRESAQTGEPVANLTRIPASCPADAARIAARVPQLSFGYTRLDATHQDSRFDLSLGTDITQAFAGLKVDLPGLGQDASAPFDLSLAVPMAELRTFWLAQADAVAAKPFTCPAVADLNAGFARLGAILQKAATPPLGDLVGLRVALDKLDFAPGAALPDIEGRVLLATRNPAGLLGMAQLSVPALSQVRVPANGTPVALPANLSGALGAPAWAAMDSHALAVAVGSGQDAKLGDMLRAPSGDAGRLLRMHVDGSMYASWIKAMAQKLGRTTAAASPDDPDAKARLAGLQSRLAALQTHADQVQEVSAEIHMDAQGLVISNRLTLK